MFSVDRVFNRFRTTEALIFLCFACTVSHAATAQDNWPQFRGPKSDGVVAATGLPDTWSKTENVAWNVEIPGRGWSSPIVWGDRVFLTTAIRMGGTAEEIKKGLYFGGDRPAPKDPHRWVVYCLNAGSGEIVWQKTVHEGVPQYGHHLKNTLASETPITDGERVYAYFGNVGLFCFDLNGKELWQKKWDSVPTKLGWGTAASPVLYQGRIYVVNDNEKESFLMASTRKVQEIGASRVKRSRTGPRLRVGERAADRDHHPGLGQDAGVRPGRQPTVGARRLVIAIPTPFERFGMLYVASGYVLDKRKPIFAIRPGASGDITLKDKETTGEFIAWSQLQAGPYNVSPIVYGDYLYVLYDMGFFACYDARTGRQMYENPKVRTGGSAFTASPWAYDGKIFCLSEDGDTFVIEAGKEFKVLRKNSLDEFTMATPAIANGSLFIRTEKRLYRITNGAGKAAATPAKEKATASAAGN
jgi:outer membrane protein assembly factor BamB